MRRRQHPTRPGPLPPAGLPLLLTTGSSTAQARMRESICVGRMTFSRSHSRLWPAGNRVEAAGGACRGAQTCYSRDIRGGHCLECEASGLGRGSRAAGSRPSRSLP